MASTDLTRTFSSGNRKKHTFSAWMKLSHIGSTSNTFFANRPDGNNRFYYQIANNSVATFPNQFYCYMVQGGSAVLDVYGSAKLRDVNGWYHIVVRMDTTQATGSDRFRLYINGEQQTLTFTHTPDLNEDLQVNKAETHYIGEEGNGNGQFDGSMSHIHFCDGYSYAPTEFGETDSTTGEWKIKTNPSLTYGTNGFWILKDGNSVTDQSGNSNNFTVAGGTLTNTEDCPSNVFATMNPLENFWPGSTFSNGNNTVATASTPYAANLSTLGMQSGKYYMECKISADGSSSARVGIAGYPARSASQYLGSQTDQISYSSGAVYKAGSSQSGTWASFAVNDILSVAIDCDNNYVYFGKNGTWQNSGDPTSGSSGTGGVAITAPLSTELKNYFFGCSDNANNGGSTFQFNFGNGYFGTTAISSEGTNASGIGKFEYNVPTGYTALSTKGLNE
jgi:hypothetical protein